MANSSSARRMTAMEGRAGVDVIIIVTANSLHKCPEFRRHRHSQRSVDAVKHDPTMTYSTFARKFSATQEFAAARLTYRLPATPATMSPALCQKIAGTRLLYVNRLAPRS